MLSISSLVVFLLKEKRIEVLSASFLGKISYGLYMYHMMVVVFIIKIGLNFMSSDGFWFNIYVYSLTLISTIVLASASYYWLETPFLKLKGKFTVVKSGSNK